MKLVTTTIIITVRIGKKEINKIDIYRGERQIYRVKKMYCSTEKEREGERELLYYCNSSERLFEREMQ